MSHSSNPKMDAEENVRTVDCLRGRLLAERVASRNAKMEAEELENKLMQLESLLKKEGKSRNRAQKKLKSLMKKLESNNISYASSESGLLDRSDITSTSSSSPSSSSSSCTDSLKSEDKNSKIVKVKDIPISSMENVKSPTGLHALKPADSEVTDSLCQIITDELESTQGTTNELESTQGYTVVASTDALSVKSAAEEEVIKDNDYEDQDEENLVDNSLAIVAVEKQETKQTIDPEVLDATVKEVLDALRHAKEQLQSSMEKRRREFNMIKVG